jgi:hypothetical protein
MTCWSCLANQYPKHYYNDNGTSHNTGFLTFTALETSFYVVTLSKSGISADKKTGLKAFAHSPDSILLNKGA